MTFVVAHDEDDLVLAVDAVLSHKLGDVNAGHGGGRNIPRRRHVPVARVYRVGVEQNERARLALEICRLDRRDLSPTRAAVPAHAIDVDPIVAGRRVDLKLHSFAMIDAELYGIALDVGRQSAVDFPVAATG